ncbi:hypothetical protein [Streptomyces sp. NPDC001985]|uniref:hypothetical protein n=1 Tax=Streptomyces sp. NPDC001985 TaxID=3154406 RepID=UPI00332AA4CA
MTLWLSGMRITSDRLNNDDPDEETSAGLVAGSGFSTLSFQGRRYRGVVYINALLTKNSGTIEAVAGSGNLSPEPTIGTLPDGWRPPESLGVSWDNGTVEGVLLVNTNGTLVLRTITYNQAVANATNIRFNTSWIKA